MVEGDAPPPAGAAVRVEIRDISVADAMAPVVASASGQVALSAAGDSPAIARVTLEIDRVPDIGTVWAHVDVDGDGSVSVGDFITSGWCRKTGGASRPSRRASRI